MSIFPSIFPMLVFVLLFMVALPAAIGVYVYRDAKLRGMEPVAWALIAALSPSLIGLIVYLVIRSKHSPLNCPSCGMEVEPGFCVCPGCGCRFKGTCPSCGYAVEPGWHVCPSCAASLPEDSSVVSPVKRKDKGLVWLILVAILIPVLLLGSLLLFGFSASSTYNGGIEDSIQAAPEW